MGDGKPYGPPSTIAIKGCGIFLVSSETVSPKAVLLLVGKTLFSFQIAFCILVYNFINFCIFVYNFIEAMVFGQGKEPR